jgi:hypothetical protein
MRIDVPLDRHAGIAPVDARVGENGQQPVDVTATPEKVARPRGDIGLFKDV